MTTKLVQVLNTRTPALERFEVSGVITTGKELGRGSYGSVEEVKIPGAVCAAKRLHETLIQFGSHSQVQRWVTQFVTECELMSSLRHPNIVQFIGICYLPGSELPVLLLEKLQTCLHGLLEEKPGLPLDGKHSILVGTISGLVFLHSHTPSIIHRDFTARNILLDKSLTPKITDMGVARMVTIQPGQVAATMTQAPGNIIYMPQEAVGDRVTKYNTAIDVFSFGNVALFTLTEIFPKDLRPPSFYDSKSRKLLGRSEIERRSDYLQFLYQQLGQAHPLVQLVHSCLEFLPEDRPSALNILEQLEVIGGYLPQSGWNKTKLELFQTVGESQARIDRLAKHALDKQKQSDYLSECLQRKIADHRSVCQQLTESRFTATGIGFDKVLGHQEKMDEIKRLITKKIVDKETQLQVLMTECGLGSPDIANIVLQLLEEVEGEDGIEDWDGRKYNYPLQHYVEAAMNHGDIDKAREFLIKECTVCYEKLPVHEFVAMPGCTHSVCKECFKSNFSLVIKEQEVKHFTCPICGEPDMDNKDITEGVYLERFLNLIKEHLDHDCYKMCCDKLTDFNLMKEENFIWCSNTGCRSGFIHEGRALDVACPNCHKSMCSKCTKQWEPAHEGISCEAFAQWKIDNDPNAQEQGLAAYLQANGIECPRCHFIYDLAKGGCMHAKCVRCPNEFCIGCGQSFNQGQACGKLESCKNKGLHAHHPRDCLFHMRDLDVEEFQGLLCQHNIYFIIENLMMGQRCHAMLQKEKVDGLKDEECGGEVVNGHAGLCKTHYKEYLVDLINRNKLDPITLYRTLKIGVMLTREEIDLPDKDDEDDDDLYRDKLIELVKQNLPLSYGRGQATALLPPDPQPPAQ